MSKTKKKAPSIPAGGVKPNFGVVRPNTIWTKERIAQFAADPSKRAQIPGKYLPAKFAAQRKFNAAPITPGSSITNRELNHQATAATDVQYGAQQAQAKQNVQSAQNLGTAQAGWYDQYLQQLAQHEQNIAGIGQQAVGNTQSLAGAIQGLNQQTQTPGESAQNASNASNASAVQQALLASMGGLASATAGDANRLADTQAHVVAPGQNLQAKAQAAGQVKNAQDALTQFLGTVGAAKQSYKDTASANEVKNIQTAQALGVTAQNDAASTAIKQQNADTAAKKVTVSTKVAKQSAADKATAGDHYGYTNAEWAKMNPAARTQAAASWKKATATPKTPKKPAPVKPVLTPANQAKTVSGIKTAASAARTIYAQLLSAGQTPGAAQHQTRQILMGQSQVNGKTSPYKYSSSDTNVAMDLAVNKYVSPANVKYLHSLSIDLGKYGLPYTKPQAPPVQGISGSGKAKTS